MQMAPCYQYGSAICRMYSSKLFYSAISRHRRLHEAMQTTKLRNRSIQWQQRLGTDLLTDGKFKIYCKHSAFCFDCPIQANLGHSSLTETIALATERLCAMNISTILITDHQCKRQTSLFMNPGISLHCPTLIHTYKNCLSILLTSQSKSRGNMLALPNSIVGKWQSMPGWCGDIGVCSTCGVVLEYTQFVGKRLGMPKP